MGGLLIVTLPKEKKIQEIKEDSRKIPVEHKQSRTEDARSESSMRKTSMEKERKSSVEKEMKTSRRSSFESEKNEQSSTLERKTGQKINVERKSSTGSDKKTQQSSIVPMNLRNTFFDDPFFQDNWLDIQQSQRNFFSQAEEEFKKRMDLMESSMNERFSLSKFFDMDKSDWMNAKLPEFSKLNLVDEHELKIVDVEDKLEISLDHWIQT